MSISTHRFGKCRGRKGAIAEGSDAAGRAFLGLRRICAGLSPNRVEC